MEYVQFLHIALGSLREIDTQLIIAKEVDLADKNLFIPLLNEFEEMQNILVATLNKLKVLIYNFLLPTSALCLSPTSDHQKLPRTILCFKSYSD